MNKRRVGAVFTMPIKVLLREKNELRLRFIGEDHTSLQIFRQRLNSTRGVEYVNYFPGHPLLEDPEFYIRTTGKSEPEKLLRKLCSNLQTEFTKLSV